MNPSSQTPHTDTGRINLTTAIIGLLTAVVTTVGGLALFFLQAKKDPPKPITDSPAAIKPVREGSPSKEQDPAKKPEVTVLNRTPPAKQIVPLIDVNEPRRIYVEPIPTTVLQQAKIDALNAEARKTESELKELQNKR